MTPKLNRILLAATITALTAPAFGAPPVKYTVVPVKAGGTLKGAVKFKGKTPAPKKILITKDESVCGKGERVIVEVAVGAGGGLKNAVVYLKKIVKGKKWASPKKKGGLSQKGCRFTPEMLVVRKKSKLAIVNNDTVAHNIHAYELIGRARRTLFNQSQPNQGDNFTQIIKPRRSSYVKLECDVHNFMHAYMFAAENPYYALTNAKGEYSIKDIPPGRYAVGVWHPKLGEKKATVTIPAGKTATKGFSFMGKAAKKS